MASVNGFVACVGTRVRNDGRRRTSSYVIARASTSSAPSGEDFRRISPLSKEGLKSLVNASPAMLNPGHFRHADDLNPLGSRIKSRAASRQRKFPRAALARFRRCDTICFMSRFFRFGSFVGVAFALFMAAQCRLNLFKQMSSQLRVSFLLRVLRTI